MKTLWICMLVCCVSFSAFGGISISTDGGNRTVTLEYTHTIAKVSTTLEKAAANLYRQGIGNVFDGGDLVPFDDLTNNQKLNVVWLGVRQFLVQKALEQHVNTAVRSARDTAKNEDIFMEE